MQRLLEELVNVVFQLDCLLFLQHRSLARFVSLLPLGAVLRVRCQPHPALNRPGRLLVHRGARGAGVHAGIRSPNLADLFLELIVAVSGLSLLRPGVLVNVLLVSQQVVVETLVAQLFEELEGVDVLLARLGQAELGVRRPDAEDVEVEAHRAAGSEDMNYNLLVCEIYLSARRN